MTFGQKQYRTFLRKVGKMVYRYVSLGPDYLGYKLAQDASKAVFGGIFHLYCTILLYTYVYTLRICKITSDCFRVASKNFKNTVKWMRGISKIIYGESDLKKKGLHAWEQIPQQSCRMTWCFRDGNPSGIIVSVSDWKHLSVLKKKTKPTVQGEKNPTKVWPQ